jgi:hypothetical protein
MKKFASKMITGSLVLFFFFTACKRVRDVDIIKTENEGGQTITTIEKTQLSLKFSYTGTIKLNNDKTAFVSISPNGYVNYKKGSTKLVVSSDVNGVLTFEIDGGNKKTTLNEADKKFVSEILQDMITNGGKFQ